VHAGEWDHWPTEYVNLAEQKFRNSHPIQLEKTLQVLLDSWTVTHHPV